MVFHFKLAFPFQEPFQTFSISMIKEPNNTVTASNKTFFNTAIIIINQPLGVRLVQERLLYYETVIHIPG